MSAPGAAAPLRVWVDAQLPPALARWLVAEQGLEASHVQDLGLLAADDRDKFERARDAGVVIITKDVDFVQLLERHGPPPQVVWMTVGNTTKARLREIMNEHWERVATLLLAGEPLVELGGRR